MDDSELGMGGDASDDSVVDALLQAKQRLHHTVPEGLSALRYYGDQWSLVATSLETATDLLRSAFEILFEDSNRLSDPPSDWTALERRLATRFVWLVAALNDISLAASADATPSNDEITNLLGSLATFAEEARLMGESMVPVIRKVLRDNAATAVVLRDNYMLWQASRQAAATAVASADAAKEAAGEASTVSLSDEFESLRDREARAAELFRGGAILLYIATVAFAATVAFWLGKSDPLSREVVQRLAAGIPLLALAAYLGHEGRGHRRTASWAAVLVAQLRSVRAYTGQLSPGDRDALLTAFGRRVLLETPGKDPSPVEAEAEPVDAVAIMREAATLIERARKGPGPETGAKT